jgi:hypothetical protein
MPAERPNRGCEQSQLVIMICAILLAIGEIQEEKMDDDGVYKLRRINRAPSGQPMTTHNLSLPEYLLALIKQEAEEKNKSVSLVASYLILAGLKAHVGEFKPPADNSIRRNYEKRGRKWS